MRLAAVLTAALALATVASSPAGAIVNGHRDGHRHPWVGAMVFAHNDHKALLCSGTLISPTVFLTASHCTAYLESIGVAPDDVWVTFDPVFHPRTSTLYAGTYHTNPLFGTGGESDTHDVAVVVLDEPITGIEPARLPRKGLLEDMQSDHTLRDERFVAVGYGTKRTSPTGGPHAFAFDMVRRYAIQQALSLHTAWLTLSENPSTGNGGTCYGDSGGPHFLGLTNIVVSITVTGDAMCRATDTTYRMDTRSAREFLDDYVTLP